MATILLLGGRAPVTLELARVFHHAGHRVITAESVRLPLASFSRAVSRHYQIPAAHDWIRFGESLATIINAERATFLVATCEEIFHIARCRELLPSTCKVFVPSLFQLRDLHNKILFVEKARGYGLSVPSTARISKQADLAPLLSQSDHLVFKPAYSRFATQTLIRPTPEQVKQYVRPTRIYPWAAQGYIEGKQWCTYSIAHNGHLTAHATYPAEYTAGQGAAVAFRSVDHPAVRRWVETFVAHENFTGQVAFDFIETDAGEVYAIECNPRATSGVHLLATHPHFARAFFDADMTCAIPAPDAQAMLGLAMLLYGSPKSLSCDAWRHWWHTLRASRDVIYRGDDPKPLLGQLLGLTVFLARALRHRITPLAATTWDIEWNGEGARDER